MKIKDLKVGIPVELKSLKKEEHKTMPPGRYLENLLISRLDSLSIGRPSSYNSMISVIQTRGYVQKLKGGYLAPTFKGFAMMNIMLKHFPKYVDYGYTAEMEENLDEIAEGKQTRVQFLKDFWFGKNNDGFDAFVKNLSSNINWDEIKEFSTIDLHNGYSIVYNNYGSFLQDNNGEKNDKGYLPSVKIDDDGLIEDYLDAEKCKEIFETVQNTPGPRVLGVLDSGEYKGWEVNVKTGKYGDYVQAVAPESEGKKVKPINHTLPEGLTIEKVVLEDVVPLFAEVKLPRWSDDGKYLVGINKKGGQYAGFKSTPKAKKLQFKELPKEYDPKTVDFKIVEELFKKNEN